MGDASPVDPSMGGDAMTDPMMAGGDPSMGMGQGVGEEIPEDGMDDSNMNEKVKEITDISNELDEKGQETILKYARSVKDNSNSGQDSSEPETEPETGNEGPQMPMESVIFTKGQLKKINEGLGAGMDDEKDDKKLTKRTDKTINKVKSSPFNSPRFK